VNVEREPLRETIRKQLASSIILGKRGAGERIRLVETAEEIGVSMTPLREALVQLEIDGFVHSEPGKGYSVLKLTAKEVEEVYPLVWNLETVALRAGPPTKTVLAKLDRLNQRFRSSINGCKAMELDREWHSVLLSRCQNKTLFECLDVLKSRAARYEVAFLQEELRVEASADQHAEIVNFIRGGDIDGATATLQENWRDGPRMLLPWLARRVVSVADGAVARSAPA